MLSNAVMVAAVFRVITVAPAYHACLCGTDRRNGSMTACRTDTVDRRPKTFCYPVRPRAPPQSLGARPSTNSKANRQARPLVINAGCLDDTPAVLVDDRIGNPAVLA